MAQLTQQPSDISTSITVRFVMPAINVLYRIVLYQARAQWSPLEEPKLGSEVDLSSFSVHDAAQRHCAAPAIVHVPGTGRTLQAPPNMAPRSKKMGAASQVASEFVAPTPTSANGSSKGTLKGTTSPGTTYCHYLGGLVTALDRVVRIPKMIVDSAVTCVLNSSKSERTAHLKSISIKSIKASLVLIGLLAFSVYVLPPHRSPFVILYRFCPGMTSRLRQLSLNALPGYALPRTRPDLLLPHLNAAPSISTKDFDMSEPVDVSSDAVAEYKIVSARRHLRALRTALDSYSAGQPAQMHEALDFLVSDVVLPNIHRGRSLVSLEQLVYYDLFKERGAYFPTIHWDTQWLQYPGADGFQIWYLLEENDEEGGNMFMVKTNDLRDDDPSVRYFPTKTGGVVKTIHDSNYPESPLKAFSTFNESGLGFQYLDMHAGDCLIFSKRTLHMSDPRPFLAGRSSKRLALNVRFIVRGEDEDTIPFSPTHISQTVFPMNAGLKHWALRRAKQAGQFFTPSVIRVPVSRFDMLNQMKSPW